MGSSGPGYSLPGEAELRWKSGAVEGDSPVGVTWVGDFPCPGVPGVGIRSGSRGLPAPKAKYVPRPIAHEYREGKLKSTPDGE